MIKIDKSIPIPIRTRRGTYPFADMQIGDSFFVTLKNDYKTKRSLASSIHGSAKYMKKTIKDFKITIRSVENGVRCWRVE